MKTVIEMAREAGFSSLELEFRDGERLERFAALVRAEASKERYFCQRCGKRVGDKNGVWEGIHTCTPPENVRR